MTCGNNRWNANFLYPPLHGRWSLLPVVAVIGGMWAFPRHRERRPDHSGRCAGRGFGRMDALVAHSDNDGVGPIGALAYLETRSAPATVALSPTGHAGRRDSPRAAPRASVVARSRSGCVDRPAALGGDGVDHQRAGRLDSGTHRAAADAGAHGVDGNGCALARGPGRRRAGMGGRCVGGFAVGLGATLGCPRRRCRRFLRWRSSS